MEKDVIMDTLTNHTDYSKIAEDYFEHGYNCAQSVLLTFAKEINLDKETVLKLSSSFGGGMGRLREVCGAVSAMFMIAGFLKGYSTPNDDLVKQKHYELIQELANTFKNQYGTIICRELLGEAGKDNSFKPSKRTEAYYNERPCKHFIGFCAKIIKEKLI